MQNNDIVRALETIATLMEIKDEAYYRVLGYQRAAESVAALGRPAAPARTGRAGRRCRGRTGAVRSWCDRRERAGSRMSGTTRERAYQLEVAAVVEAARTTSLGDRLAWARLHRRWGRLCVEPQTEPLMRHESDLAETMAVCGDGLAWMAGNGDRDIRAALLVRLVQTRRRLDCLLAGSGARTP